MEQTTVELDGYGSGYGYGDGDAKTIQDYLAALLQPYQRGPNMFCFWRSTKEGYAVNGGKSKEAHVGLIEIVNGPLKLCTKNALHGTLNPDKWKSERWWIVELHQPVAEGCDKLGSLQRTIIADLGECPF